MKAPLLSALLRAFATVVAACAAGMFAASAAHAQIYVSDNGYGNVSSYTLTGIVIDPNIVTAFPSAAGLAVSTSGNVYVASQRDAPNGFVAEYSPTGSLITTISNLDSPLALTFSASGNLYIAGHGVVGEYQADGTPINASLITGLDDASGIAFDGSGDIFVTNYLGNSIGEYSSSGSPINTALISGINNPFGIAYFGGNLYIADSGNSTIDVYSASGSFIDSFGTDARPTMLSIVHGIIYEVNQNAHTLNEYTLSGTQIPPNPLINGFNDAFGMVAVPEPADAALAAGLLAAFVYVGRRAKSAPPPSV